MLLHHDSPSFVHQHNSNNNNNNNNNSETTFEWLVCVIRFGLVLHAVHDCAQLALFVAKSEKHRKTWGKKKKRK
jgi:hypothetical protein